jgi:hypothetical protein
LYRQEIIVARSLSQVLINGIIGIWLPTGIWAEKPVTDKRTYQDLAASFQQATLNNMLRTAYAGVVSNSVMKWLILTVAVLLVLLLVWAWLGFSGRASYFILGRGATITVNGAPVPGHVLFGRATAIVTTREAGKEHSYEVRFAGDTDNTGNMGNVIDCHEWVAPRFPVLFETRNYPPCVARPEDGPESSGWPLMNRQNGMQFVTKNGQTITLTLRR